MKSNTTELWRNDAFKRANHLKMLRIALTVFLVVSLNGTMATAQYASVIPCANQPGLFANVDVGYSFRRNIQENNVDQSVSYLSQDLRPLDLVGDACMLRESPFIFERLKTFSDARFQQEIVQGNFVGRGGLGMFELGAIIDPKIRLLVPNLPLVRATPSLRLEYVNEITQTEAIVNENVPYMLTGASVDYASFMKDTLNNRNTHKTEEGIKRVSKIKDTISVIGVGDIMLGTNYPSNKFLSPNDGKYLLEPVKSILKSADIATGNLEGTFLTRNAKPREYNDSSVSYRFKMPDHYIKYLEDAGFAFLNIANNHINDFGEIGKQNTVKILKESNIKYAGLEECPYAVLEKDGIRFGFCGFSPHSGTVNINNIEEVKSILKHLDATCDIVIASVHIGAEGAKNRHVTREDEFFLGQDRGNPYKFAREVIDAGADIVFCHGPHVTRAVDIYKNRFIAYSLGNFATYGLFSLKGVSGIAPIIKVFVNRKGEFLYADVYSIVQRGKGGPTIDENNRAFQEIKTLTETDIPESKLQITNNKIYPKRPNK